MPVMNGMDSSKTIREKVPADYQPYIVALTAQAMQGDRYSTSPITSPATYLYVVMLLCCYDMMYM
jgi:CheY-like chemotaxis protein